MSMRLQRVALAFILICATAITGAHPASAGLIYQQNSEANSTNPTTLPMAYRIVNVEATVDSDNSDLLIIKVNFLENPKADIFVAGNTRPLLRIKLFKKYTNGQPIDGGYGDVWIDSPATPYQFMGVQSPAPVSAMKSVGASPYDPRISLPDCQGKSWIETFGQEPWVKFSVSMSCIKLPDKFSVLAFVDADTNASYQVDYKFAPLKPMAIDLTGVNRPRPKESQVASISQLSSFDLRTKQVNVSASAQRIDLYGDQKTPNALQYNSLTPSVCAFVSPSQSALNLLSKGTCTVEAFAVGDSTVTESNRAQMSFTVNPIPMQNQTLSYYQPYDVTEGDPEFEVNVSASSGLPVVIKSNDASVCYFKDPINNPRLVTIMGWGTCDFTVTQAGNELYYPTSGRAYFDVAQKPQPNTTPTKAPTPQTTQKPEEKVLGGTGSAASGQTQVQTQTKTDAVAEKAKATTTIKCKKGKTIKTVVGTKCPTGYVKTK